MGVDHRIKLFYIYFFKHQSRKQNKELGFLHEVGSPGDCLIQDVR